jgi:ABC-type amino acid transport substrate-binding protein
VPKFTFNEYPNQKRLYIESLKGKTTMPIITLWEHEIVSDKFFQTKSLLNKGQIEIGVYVKPDKLNSLIINTTEDLKKLTAVTQSDWTIDKDALIQMGISYTTTSRFINMFKMVDNGRADFLLASFSAESTMSKTVEGVTLEAIKGIKINLPYTRSYVVYKNSLNSTIIFNALQKGLKILKKEGKLEKYFEKIGYINARVKNWQVLCCSSHNNNHNTFNN